MPSIYVWPSTELDGKPIPKALAGSLKPSLWIDSQTINRKYRPGSYMGVWSPAPEPGKPMNWSWWCENMEKIAASLSAQGVVIEFVFIDLEWERNKLTFPYYDVDRVVHDFVTARTIIRHFFPKVGIAFHGDNYEVPNVSWTGKQTGSHPFHAWQERDSQLLGDWPTHITQFWSTPGIGIDNLTETRNLLENYMITHWVEKAKSWTMTSQTDKDGKVTSVHEQADNPVTDVEKQRFYGKVIATARCPIMLYWVTSFEHPNLLAFLGKEAATV